MGADNKNMVAIIKAYMSVGVVLQDVLRDHELSDFGDSGKDLFYALRNHCGTVKQKVEAIYAQYLNTAVERRSAESHRVELTCGIGFPVNGTKEDAREFLDTEEARKLVEELLDTLKGRPELMMEVKSITAVIPEEE